MRREVVGRAAGRRAHQHPVADQLGQAFLAVHQDAHLGGLAAFAQQRDLVDRERLLRRAVAEGAHAQRVQRGGLRGGDARGQVVLAVVVHQEADRSAVHAIDRHAAAAQEAVQRLQHEAVAAQRHHHVGAVGVGGAVARGQRLLRRPRRLVLRGEDGEARGAHALAFATQSRAAVRCSISGMPARTRAVMAWSMRAVAQPMPSLHFATTWPQGSATSEWP